MCQPASDPFCDVTLAAGLLLSLVSWCCRYNHAVVRQRYVVMGCNKRAAATHYSRAVAAVSAATQGSEQIQCSSALTTLSRDHLPTNSGAACPILSTATAHVAKPETTRPRRCVFLTPGAWRLVATHRVCAPPRQMARSSAAPHNRPAHATLQPQGSRLQHAAHQVSPSAQRTPSSPFVVLLASARHPALPRPACNDLLLSAACTSGVCVVCPRSGRMECGWVVVITPQA